MPQQPKVGEDVTALMNGGSTPAVGDDVTALMGGQPAPMTFAIVNGQRVPVPAEDNSVGTFLSHVGTQVNPITAIQATGNALLHPLDTAKAISAAQGALYDKARESYAKGDYVTAARHLVDYLLPIVGPTLDTAADRMQAGQYAAGAGDAVGLGLSIAGPQALSDLRVKGPTLGQNVNPAEAAAVQFGREQGVPIDAATQTGNPFVRGVQKLTDNTIGGSIIGRRARQGQAEALSRVGGELAEAVHPEPVTAEQAGEGARGAVQGIIRDFHAQATDAYTKLRELEAGDVLTTMQGAVDLRQSKAMLKPIYDRIMRQLPITQQRSSPGLKAIENIIQGPDFAPASVVDTDLGTIKGIARGADLPELRDMSRGLAAAAVKQLDTAVREAVARIGPEATQALESGRAATKAKYAAAEVLRGMREEPVQMFNQAIYAKDAGIKLLRALQELAPMEMQKIGRAYLEDLLQTATAEGGFDRTAGLMAKWQRLGPETKRVLFGPSIAGQLDHFFLLAKKIGENPNPSGTAAVASIGAQGAALLTNPIATIIGELGAAGVAKMLYSGRGIGALNRAAEALARVRTLPAKSAARAAAIGNLLRAAQAMGVDVQTPAVATAQAQ